MFFPALPPEQDIKLHNRSSRVVVPKFALLCVGLCVLTMSGCGSTGSAPSSGTLGILTSADHPVAEFELKIYPAGESTPLGVGVTGLDGRFQLSKLDGTGGCRLPPGEYHISVVSIGPALLKLPASYGDPQKTPLRIKWKAEDTELKISLPSLK